MNPVTKQWKEARADAVSRLSLVLKALKGAEIDNHPSYRKLTDELFAFVEKADRIIPLLEAFDGAK